MIRWTRPPILGGVGNGLQVSARITSVWCDVWRWMVFCRSVCEVSGLFVVEWTSSRWLLQWYRWYSDSDGLLVVVVAMWSLAVASVSRSLGRYIMYLASVIRRRLHATRRHWRDYHCTTEHISEISLPGDRPSMLHHHASSPFKRLKIRMYTTQRCLSAILGRTI